MKLTTKENKQKHELTSNFTKFHNKNSIKASALAACNRENYSGRATKTKEIQKRERERRKAHMEELELVFEVLEGGPDGVEALGFADGGVAVTVVVGGPEVLDENETGRAVIRGGVGKVRWRVVFEDFDGSEKVGSGDGVNGVAELVVEVPNFLHNRFDFLHLHIPFHFLLLLFGGEWTQRNTAQHTAQAVTQYNPQFFSRQFDVTQNIPMAFFTKTKPTSRHYLTGGQ